MLQKARSNNFWAVSATPASMEQTYKLVQASDMVLRRKQPYTMDEEYPSFGPHVIEPCSKEATRLLQNVSFGNEDDEADSNGEKEEDDNGTDDESTSDDDDNENDETISDDSDKDESESSNEDDDVDDEDGGKNENDNSFKGYDGESIPAHLRPLLNVKVTPNGLVNMTPQNTVETLTPIVDSINKLPLKNRISQQLQNMTLEDMQQELEKRNLLDDDSITTDRLVMTKRLRQAIVSDIVKVRLQEHAKLSPYQRPDESETLLSILQQVGLVKRKRSLAKMAVMLHCAEHGREMQRFQPFEVDKTLKNLHRENLHRELEKRGIESFSRSKEVKKKLEVKVEEERVEYMDKLVRESLKERGESPKGDASIVCYRLVRSVLGIKN